MSKIKIEIDLGNDAFKGDDGEDNELMAGIEVAGILKRIAAIAMEDGVGGASGALLDSNGNRVGEVELISG